MEDKKIARRYEEISRALEKVLGDPNELHQVSPLAHCNSALEVLIATILTQATSDRNALKAWRNIKRTCLNLEGLYEIKETELYEIIKTAGLAKQKSETILGVLNAIKERTGSFTLEIFENKPEEAWDFLISIPGVGIKTAACTMLFGFGIPHFPVDVHIYRIIKRLGWYDKIDLKEIQERLKVEVPVEIQAKLHILLLNLGRKFCRPKRPKCEECPIKSECNKQL